MSNRLAGETSPYLLQHAANPVHWYPWGEEALAKAREEDKPILLSIGYAACHWCHVMAHESFEDETTAQLMNEHFVNVKVDREERPDLDAIYMQAVQAMTGHGGWPMTMFLTPAGEPFYGGTYFPPADRHGLPSFRRVLTSVADAYKNRRSAIAETAKQLREVYRPETPAVAGELSAHSLEIAFRTLSRQYDSRHGGFGGAPKFPPTMALDFLLRYWGRTGNATALEMALETFRAMSRGGIYDQIGGGFARYSVDERWLVPHFEKMLYDNALLIGFGVQLWRATKDAEVKRVIEETLRWIEREMTSPEGAFYSSLDADSEGHEGKFYVWSSDELDRLLGDDAAIARTYFGVEPAGNFEGKSILTVSSPIEVVAARTGADPARIAEVVGGAKSILYEARAKRVWPGRDNKIVASWNGLATRAVIRAGFAFASREWYDMALRSAEFLDRELVRDGRVWRIHKDGRTHTPGFLEDQAAVTLAFLEIYSITCDNRWLVLARRCADVMVERFYDGGTATFFDTADDAERLITRPRDATDNAMPSGSSLAAELLLSLAELDEDSGKRDLAIGILSRSAAAAERLPSAFGHMLGVADMAVHGSVQIAIAGHPDHDRFKALQRVVAESYVPSAVFAGGDPEAPDAPTLLRGRPAGPSDAMAYVCRRFTCDLPAIEPDALHDRLEAAAKP